MIFKEHTQLASLDTQVALTEDLIDTLNEGINFKEIKNKIIKRISDMWKSFLSWLKNIGDKIKLLIEKVKLKSFNKEKEDIEMMNHSIDSTVTRIKTDQTLRDKEWNKAKEEMNTKFDEFEENLKNAKKTADEAQEYLRKSREEKKRAEEERIKREKEEAEQRKKEEEEAKIRRQKEYEDKKQREKEEAERLKKEEERKEKERIKKDEMLKSKFTKEELEILESSRYYSRLKSALIEKDHKTIRRRIVTLVDNYSYTKEKLNPFLKIAKKYVKVFDSHQERGKMLPKEKWNEDYSDDLYSDLMKNFSEKRFDHYIQVMQYLNNKSEGFIFILENVLLEAQQKIAISKKALPISSQKLRSVLLEIKNPKNTDSVEKNKKLIERLNSEFDKFNNINEKIMVDNSFIATNLQKLSNEINLHSKNLENLYKISLNSASNEENNELVMSKVQLLSRSIVIVKELFETCVNSAVKNN